MSVLYIMYGRSFKFNKSLNSTLSSTLRPLVMALTSKIKQYRVLKVFQQTKPLRLYKLLHKLNTPPFTLQTTRQSWLDIIKKQERIVTFSYIRVCVNNKSVKKGCYCRHLAMNFGRVLWQTQSDSQVVGSLKCHKIGIKFLSFLGYFDYSTENLVTWMSGYVYEILLLLPFSHMNF